MVARCALTLTGKNILVLGAYGFIGAAVVRALRCRGAQVTGLVRKPVQGALLLDGIKLVQGDLRRFTHPQDWEAALTGIDCVVNCAGALQDGPSDDLAAVHHHAIAALGQACGQRGVSVVQISAIGATPNADTEFMRTKAAGDAALEHSGADLWILRPGLVIGQSDYGGTTLLRMLAAVPLVQPIAYPATPVRCVGMEDLCHAVVTCCADEVPQGAYDLVEDQAQSLRDVLATTRRWLGFPAARFRLVMPPVLTKAVARCADALGYLGWRSPLRSTAMTVMASGVAGDPAPYRAATSRSLRPLPEIYGSMTSAREHRLTARMSLLAPLVITVLSLFWVLSGIFGLVGLPEAAGVLTEAGWADAAAVSSVVFWSFVDIALGLAVLYGPWTARVCLAQVGVAAFYVLAATVVTPGLWLDPLGPLVKVLPAMLLSLVAWPMVQSR